MARKNHRQTKRKHTHARGNGMNGKVCMAGTLNMHLPNGQKWSASQGVVRAPKQRIKMW